MKLKLIVSASILLLCGLLVNAQTVSADSVNNLKQQKNILDLGQQVNDQKLKLVKLENSIEKQLATTRKAQEKAQQSADENASIAEKLAADPSDKKLSRKARNAARDAQKCAKKSRQETDDLEGLQKDIDSLKKQVADGEAKLATMQQAMKPVN